MKRTLILFLVIVLCTLQVRASHFAGGEIRYEYNGTNYTIYGTKYLACQSSVLFDTSMFITINSASLSFNTTRYLKLQYVDTFKTGCLGDTTRCTNINAPITGYMALYFTDTVSLPSATDWLIEYTYCCRDNTTNLFGGTSGSSYVFATLNNSSGNNSSTRLSSYTNYVTRVNDTAHLPLMGTDIDGDSVTYEYIAPLQNATSPVGYNIGYSVTLPFGSGVTAFSADNNYMLLLSQTQGEFGLAFMVKEYRAGVLVGSYIRDFQVSCYASSMFPGSNTNTVPVPVNNANLTTYTCPGSNNSVMLNFVDPSFSDSVYVEVIPPVVPGFVFNSTVKPGIGKANVHITWSSPAGLNPALLSLFNIRLKVRDNECPYNMIEYTLQVRTRDCIADSVWPGDANSDGVVDIYDPLSIAVADGEIGTTRTGANILWAPQACAGWTNVFLTNNINMKHADCNGNGRVDATDLTAVNSNYTLSHPVRQGLGPAYADTVNTQLYLDTTGLTFEPGKSVSIPIKLGTLANPMARMYGIATTFDVQGVALSIPMAVNTSVSWLPGSAAMVDFSKSANNNTLDWAFARRDHNNNTGLGIIGRLQVDIPANTPLHTLMTINFNNLRIIDSIGRVITLGYSPIGAKVYIDFPLAVNDVRSVINTASVLPNPSGSEAVIEFSMAKIADVRVTVTDIAGRVVWTSAVAGAKGTQQVALPAGELTSGIYFVKLSAGNDAEQVMKWIKN